VHREHAGAIVADLAKLEALCKDFVKAQHIRSAESIYQMDNVIENAYEFIQGVCDIVGYFDDDENDDG
jgi:hypothetical protein